MFDSSATVADIKYHLIFRYFEEISRNDIFSESIRIKLQNILMYHKTKVINEDAVSKGLLNGFLDVNELDSATFTREEQCKIQDKLNELFFDVDTRTTDCKIDAVSDKVLLELLESLQTVMKTYTNNLLKHQGLLESMKDLRLKTLPEIAAGKLLETKLTNDINQLKRTLINKTLNMEIFKETSVALNAYKELSAHVERDQKSCELKIEELQALKDRYNLIDCQEFQEILKEYSLYKKALTNQERLNKQLENKVN